jgi:O-antigen/teichoic acid export membrane protein
MFTMLWKVSCRAEIRDLFEDTFGSTHYFKSMNASFIQNRTIAIGAVASYLNTIVSTLSNLALVPMYLFFLGNEAYGVWLTVLSIISYLGFANLGLSQSVANFVAAAAVDNDHQKVNRAAATGFWLYGVVVAGVGVVFVSILALLPVQEYLITTEDLGSLVPVVILISGGFFLLKLPLQVLNVSLRSLNMIYKEQTCMLIVNVVRFCVLVYALVNGADLVVLAFVYGVTGLIPGVLVYAALRKETQRFSISPEHFNIEQAKLLISPSLYFLLLQLSGALIWATDNIIISYQMGVAEVPPYAIAFKIFTLVIGVVSVLTANLLPTITAHNTQKNAEALRVIYTQASKLCLGLGLLICALLLLCGGQLITLWVGVDNYVGNSTFWIFVALTFVSIFLWPADAILVASSAHKGYSRMVLLEGCVNILLSIWWIQLWGLFGVAFATLVTRFCTSMWFMIYAANRHVELSIFTFLSKVVKPFVYPCAAISLLFMLIDFSVVDWVSVIGNVAACTCVYGVTVYLFALTGAEKQKLSHFVRMATNRNV